MDKVKKSQKDSGVLYIVATPIGNLNDISPRVLDILKHVDRIAAEDTRHSLPLLRHFSIETPMVALHEFNEREMSEKILSKIQGGESFALISDAGTPLISDPGYHIVSMAHDLGVQVVPVPGPCALITALCASGLAASRFIFEGFLEAKKAKRQQRLQELANETRTLVFYESPHRIQACLQDMHAIFGPDRHVVLARELTKLFETIHAAPLQELLSWLEADKNRQKGEFVTVVRGMAKEQQVQAEAGLVQVNVEQVLDVLLKELPTKQAVNLATEITGERKNLIYQMALRKLA